MHAAGSSAVARTPTPSAVCSLGDLRRMQAALTRERRAHRGPGSLYDVAGFLGEATVRAMMAASAASTTQAIGNPVS